MCPPLGILTAEILAVIFFHKKDFFLVIGNTVPRDRYVIIVKDAVRGSEFHPDEGVFFKLFLPSEFLKHGTGPLKPVYRARYDALNVEWNSPDPAHGMIVAVRQFGALFQVLEVTVRYPEFIDETGIIFTQIGKR